MSKLKVIATPIGNLGDISRRAIDEIARADLILAEDTRSALKLINFLGIGLKPETRIISCHSQMEEHRAQVVAERLRAKDNVVLLSDAGCPVISDPGSLLVQGVVAEGFDVEVIPGPSAHSAAIMGAGIDTTRFAFLGFLPQKGGVRKKLILCSAEAGLALVIYESPLRVGDLLKDLFDLLGPRRVVVARELTKLFETFHRGHLGQQLVPPLVEKGECVVIVEAGPLGKINIEEDHDTLLRDFIMLKIDENCSTKDIVKAVVSQFNIKKSDAYNLVIKYAEK